jgi:hypothetical protein
VTSQLEIYRTANVLIQQFGDEALSIATKRASALSEQDDIEGAATWLAIIRAVKVLARPLPRGRRTRRMR